MDTNIEVQELMQMRREYAEYRDLCERAKKTPVIDNRDDWMELPKATREKAILHMRGALILPDADMLGMGDGLKKKLKAKRGAIKQLTDKRDIGDHEDWGKF